jgi:hypothetical protein
VGLPCLNCGADVEVGKAQLFAECFLCDSCHTVAKRLFDQGNNELEHMKLVLKEIIRAAIVRKQLSLPPPPAEDGDGQLRQPRAVELLVEMMKGSKDECTSPPRSTSAQPKQSMRQPALTPGADGQPSSSSSPELPSKSETPSIETLATEPSDNA